MPLNVGSVADFQLPQAVEGLELKALFQIISPHQKAKSKHIFNDKT
jgi:hypothetical protein